MSVSALPDTRDPDPDRILLEKIRKLVELGRFDDVLTLAPGLFSSRFAPAAFQLAAQAALAKDDCKAAIHFADQSLAITETTLAIQLKSAALANLDQTRQALVVIDRGLELDPNNEALHYVKAQVLYSHNEPELAFLSLEQALRQDPADINYRVLQASLLIQCSRWAEADTLLASLLASQPENFKVRVNACLLALHLDNLASARSHALAALQIRPDSPSSANMRNTLSGITLKWNTLLGDLANVPKTFRFIARSASMLLCLKVIQSYPSPITFIAPVFVLAFPRVVLVISYITLLLRKTPDSHLPPDYRSPLKLTLTLALASAILLAASAFTPLSSACGAAVALASLATSFALASCAPTSRSRKVCAFSLAAVCVLAAPVLAILLAHFPAPYNFAQPHSNLAPIHRPR